MSSDDVYRARAFAINSYENGKHGRPRSGLTQGFEGSPDLLGLGNQI